MSEKPKLTPDELYKSVTAEIIAEIEKGVRPWQKGWKGETKFTLPRNAATGYVYKGGNILILWMKSVSMGYPTSKWMGFHQANQLRAKIRKGERSTPILFVDFKEETVVRDGKDHVRQTAIPVIRHVWNVAQIDDLPKEHAAPEPELPTGDDRLKAVRDILIGTKVKVLYGYAQAAYVPATDVVEMPNPGDFHSHDLFASTMFHELAHWTGHKERCNRDLSGKFGKEAYAAEECIAELASTFLCAHTGFEHKEEGAAYLEHWLKVLKQNPRHLFTLSNAASKAADYLRERAHVPEKEPELAIER